MTRDDGFWVTAMGAIWLYFVLVAGLLGVAYFQLGPYMTNWGYAMVVGLVVVGGFIVRWSWQRPLRRDRRGPMRRTTYARRRRATVARAPDHPNEWGVSGYTGYTSYYQDWWTHQAHGAQLPALE